MALASKIYPKSQKKKTSQNELREEKICMMGLGYVGLTLAVTLAELNLRVTGIDKNPQLLNTIKQGKSHFYEKGLDNLIKKYMGGYFEVSLAIPTSERFTTFIISVGTPVDTNGAPNLTAIKASANEVAEHLKRENLVILRSTVPIGTTRNIIKPILEKISGLKAGKDFSIVYAPERTVEGNALRELRELPQIIGAIDEESFIKASNLFRKTTHTIVKVASLENAEMVKIMDNTYRDLNFAISNEIALICEKLNLNAVDLIKAANMGYNRTNIPLPSPGVGGACLSKDPYILLHVTRQAGHESKFVELGRKINEYMPYYVADQVTDFISKYKRGKNSKIFILGFAFKAKPITSDIRNSPTFALVNKLKSVSQNLYGYDPAVEPQIIESAFGVKSCDIVDGFRNSDVIIIMLNHEMYTELDIFSLLATTKKPTLFYDGWQQFKSADIGQAQGIVYGGVGFA